MLYETLSQPNIIIFISLSGLISGLIFDLKNIVLFLFGNGKILNEILLGLCSFLTLQILYFSNLYINFGEIRFYIILVFFVSFFFQRFLSKKFIAKLIKRCYTYIENIKLRTKDKSDENKKF